MIDPDSLDQKGMGDIGFYLMIALVWASAFGAGVFFGIILCLAY